MTDSEPALEITKLTKRFGLSEALSGLSLTVNRGSTFGLVGINGAGKTTLIKCLLDFCDVDAGAISIFGMQNTQHSARSRIAYLPERFVPPYYLTALEFLQFMAKLYARTFELDECRTMLTLLELESDVLAKPVRALSKGMTQKLGIAGCLLSKRDLLVLDEPSSGLDPKAAHLFRSALVDAHGAGRTVFLTSHALGEIDQLCDQMAVMHHGSLKFAGSPADLKQQHQAANLEHAFLRCIGDA